MTTSNERNTLYNLLELMKDRKSISAHMQDVLYDLATILDPDDEIRNKLEGSNTLFLHILCDNVEKTHQGRVVGIEQTVKYTIVGRKGRMTSAPVSTGNLVDYSAAQGIREIHQCLYALACMSSGLDEVLVITYPDSAIVDFLNGGTPADTDFTDNYWDGAETARENLFELTRTLPVPGGIYLLYRSSDLGEP